MIPATPKTILGLVNIVTADALPSKTYALDFEKHRVVGMVDGKEAVVQAVKKCLQTERFLNLIYSWDYGVEWNRLIGTDRQRMETQLKHLLEDALKQDARITGVAVLKIQQQDRRTLVATIQINTVFGTLKEEVTAHV